MEISTMNEPDRDVLSEVRAAALARVARGERNVKLAIAGAAVFEAACLLTFLLLMDFHDRLHWLLLVMAFLIYGTLAIGLCALGAYVNLATERVLKAILLHESSTHE
jgi:hypothetical protein